MKNYIWLLLLFCLAGFISCGNSNGISGGNDNWQINPSLENNYLKEIVLSQGSLQPVFSQYTESYTVEVAPDVAEITITASALSSWATLPNGNTVVHSLAFGLNEIEIPVVAANGSTRIYTITVKRLNLNLQSLILSQGVLVPSFSPETTEYHVLVSDQRINILAEPLDPTNTVIGDGTIWVGEPKTHSIDVTSLNGSWSKSYTIHFERTPGVITFTNNIATDPKSRIPEPISPLGTVITSFTQYSLSTFVFKNGKFQVSHNGSYSFYVQSTIANGIYVLTGTFYPSASDDPITPLADYLGFIQNGNGTTFTVSLEAGVIYSWLAVFNSSVNSSGTLTITPPAGAVVTSIE